ncbi:YifB family Mg chelatase-like AAA ATPase [Bailinhaonella thermotolerans]|uniref:ATP-binding protein n=1 Tax=Bailinhaonella thermotolerans TaxID=1070861 RepID=A0A3A4AKW7_9ACTN|nr:YifB family Mg chelatase-like AAA ATPase [Bailinhaonella thermotolerans]RJL21757.1 ATP-binding protein [Bailinhaonella thermotolerans]
MRVARTRCIALVGVIGRVVEIEADILNGLPALSLIGLPDTALSEARERVRSAIVNSGHPWPDTRITVSLFPASLPKSGSTFDLAIAVAILAASGVVEPDRVAEPVFIGELGLDGRLRPVRGVLPAVLAAVEAGAGTVVVPLANAPEAALVPGLTVIPADNLGELTVWLRGGDLAAYAFTEDMRETLRAAPEPAGARPDLADVAGQAMARRALEVCAAGGHNLWMLGPPGTGKTMLAERLPTLLPRLDYESALEVTAIHSVAGTLPPDRPFVTDPPFCNPHHTASVAALVGGGTGATRPGAVSLAHRGLLFMDEAPEFARNVLDSLRQPLESGEVVVCRASGTVTFPARFMLVLAANPCPCAATSTADAPCSCTPSTRRRYLSRLSGPLLDRIDVKITLRPSTRRELLADRHFLESSEVVAERVLHARARARARLRDTPWRTNAEVPAAELRRHYAPAAEALTPLHTALDRGSLTARGLDRIIRVAWTLADLAGKPRPTATETNTAHALWLGVAS